MPKPNYDTTLARIAGNIAGQLTSDPEWRRHVNDRFNQTGAAPSVFEAAAHDAVYLARAIVAEVKRTEPREEPK